jgi:hypothetical protein
MGVEGHLLLFKAILEIDKQLLGLIFTEENVYFMLFGDLYIII